MTRLRILFAEIRAFNVAHPDNSVGRDQLLGLAAAAVVALDLVALGALLS